LEVPLHYTASQQFVLRVFEVKKIRGRVGVRGRVSVGVGVGLKLKFRVKLP
jgi:hypothetical protein